MMHDYFCIMPAAPPMRHARAARMQSDADCHLSLGLMYIADPIGHACAIPQVAPWLDVLILRVQPSRLNHTGSGILT